MLPTRRVFKRGRRDSQSWAIFLASVPAFLWKETKSPQKSLWDSASVLIQYSHPFPRGKVTSFLPYLVIVTGCPVESIFFVLVFLWNQSELHKPFGVSAQVSLPLDFFDEDRQGSSTPTNPKVEIQNNFTRSILHLRNPTLKGIFEVLWYLRSFVPIRSKKKRDQHLNKKMLCAIEPKRRSYQSLNLL